MAITVTKITGVGDFAVSNKRWHPRRLTFSGNYATGGEAITASALGLKRISAIIFQGGVAAASALSTGCPVTWDQANLKFVFFEGSSAGTALSEKTNAEAFPTGAFIDIVAIGYR